MILEDIKIRKYSRIKVSRVCDECGKIEKVSLRIVCQGRTNRGKDIDLCASCASSKKYKKYKRGKEHHCWKHGLISGYKRLTLEDGRRIREHRYIYEKYIGRALFDGEVIHHIDLDKLNNNIDNLILFSSQSEHKKCHTENMEICALTFINKKLWFNYKINRYTSKYDKISCIREIGEIDLRGLRKREWKEPCYTYLSDSREEVTRRCHVVIAEKIIRRKLYSNEIVHHIDGDYLNNSFNNLVVLTRKDHFRAHYSLQVCAANLLKMRMIGFDRVSKEYYIEK